MSSRIAVIHRADKVVNTAVFTVLFIVLLFGIYSMWDTWKILSGATFGSDLTHYKPNPGDATHLSLEQLQARNKDVCAWLTVDNTGIDYPVLQGKDNFEYLTLDTFRNYALSGSLFLDYQCDPTFESVYFIIHGHHMTESMMFGDLDKFEKQDFFEKNRSGYLMTVDKTYKLEIFACLRTDASDPYVYYTYKNDETSNQALLKYISETALHFRNIEVSGSDKLLALSTCASGQTNERTVVMAKMTLSE